MAIPSRHARGRKPIRRGPGKRIVEGKSFRAADYDGRIVTVGQLVLFSTETGDAWLLDPADRLAARLARDGENEPIHIEETGACARISHRSGHCCTAMLPTSTAVSPRSSRPTAGCPTVRSTYQSTWQAKAPRPVRSPKRLPTA